MKLGILEIAGLPLVQKETKHKNTSAMKASQYSLFKEILFWV